MTAADPPRRRRSILPTVLGPWCLGALLGCGDVGVASDDFRAAGPLVQVVDISYDGVQEGIAPCVSVPAGVYEAAVSGAADFILHLELDYDSADQGVAPCVSRTLSSLDAEPTEDPDRVTVEVLVPGPAPDDLDAVEVTATLSPTPHALQPILDGGDAVEPVP